MRWWMRKGNRLPAFAAIVEDDNGKPVPLDGAHVFLRWSRVDGLGPLVPDPVDPTKQVVLEWREQEISIANPATGKVFHDWGQLEVDDLDSGVYRLSVRVDDAVRGTALVPTDMSAELIVWG